MKREELIRLAKVRFDWKYLFESSGFKGTRMKTKRWWQLHGVVPGNK